MTVLVNPEPRQHRRREPGRFNYFIRSAVAAYLAVFLRYQNRRYRNNER